MDLLNLILNIAAVLLWVDWRSGRAMIKRSSRPAISITNSVRPTERARWRGWGSLGALLALLVVRALLYWNIGSGVKWTPRTDLVAISVPWRSDSLLLMLAYSAVSFLAALGTFFAWLLLLSALNQRVTDESDAVQRVVRLQLGPLEKLHRFLKPILAPIVSALAWVGFASLLIKAGMLPSTESALLWKQSAVLALASLFLWEWLLVIFFAIHFLNLYVYLGTHPVWNYVSQSSAKILSPVRFLRFGKVDLSPIAGIAGVIALCEYAIEPTVHRLFLR